MTGERKRRRHVAKDHGLDSTQASRSTQCSKWLPSQWANPAPENHGHKVFLRSLSHRAYVSTLVYVHGVTLPVNRWCSPILKDITYTLDQGPARCEGQPLRAEGLSVCKIQDWHLRVLQDAGTNCNREDTLFSLQNARLTVEMMPCLLLLRSTQHPLSKEGLAATYWCQDCRIWNHTTAQMRPLQNKKIKNVLIQREIENTVCFFLDELKTFKTLKSNKFRPAMIVFNLRRSSK